MVHEAPSGVNVLYCWRDLRGLIHRGPVAPNPLTRAHNTRCGRWASVLTNLGREDVSTACPNCILCVVIR